MRTASIGSLFPMMAIAAGETPGAQDESLWQYDETTDTGYYGFVPASDFISGDELSSQLNFSVGTNQNSDAGWLKFYVGPAAVCNSTPGTAKVLFVAKKTLRIVTWLNINGTNLLSGNRTISIEDLQYKVRILTGGGSSPGTNSEWNELMYRVHVDQPEGKSNWALFINIDLWVGPNLNGRNTLVQDRWAGTGDGVVNRGNTGISSWNGMFWGWNGGWRPVLEYYET